MELYIVCIVFIVCIIVVTLGYYIAIIALAALDHEQPNVAEKAIEGQANVAAKAIEALRELIKTIFKT